jgi:hypothetical protein
MTTKYGGPAPLSGTVEEVVVCASWELERESSGKPSQLTDFTRILIW